MIIEYGKAGAFPIGVLKGTQQVFIGDARWVNDQLQVEL